MDAGDRVRRRRTLVAKVLVAEGGWSGTTCGTPSFRGSASGRVARNEPAARELVCERRVALTNEALLASVWRSVSGVHRSQADPGWRSVSGAPRSQADPAWRSVSGAQRSYSDLVLRMPFLRARMRASCRVTTGWALVELEPAFLCGSTSDTAGGTRHSAGMPILRAWMRASSGRDALFGRR